MKSIHLSIIAFIVLFTATPVIAETAVTTFRVADYGTLGNSTTDDGSAIRAAFAAAKEAAGPATVVFEKKPYFVTSPPSDWHAFVLNDFSDLTIEGNGAILLCGEATLSFHFNGGKNITVRNLVLDTVTPSFTQGEVIAVDKSGAMDVKLMNGYPEPPVEAFLKANNGRAHGGGGRHMIVFEQGGRSRNTKMKNDHLYIENITKVSDGVFRFFIKEDYLPTFKDVTRGNWVTYGHNKASLPATTIKAKRKSASTYAQIAADHVENLTIENVNIYGSLNGGIRVSDMPGSVIIRNVDIIRKPETQNLISIPSDALHLMNIEGQLIVEDCNIEAPGDDCLNIGTLMETIVARSKENPRTMTLRSTDNYYYFYTINKGDRLQFLDFDTKKVLGIATVEAVKSEYPQRRLQHITLDQDIEELDTPNIRVLNLNQITTNTLLRNNTMTPYMRNAMLVRAQNMTIENNTLDCSRGGILAINVGYSMGEYARIRNLRIINNTFICPNNRSIAMHNPFTLPNGRHDTQNIQITQNTFTIGDGTAIYVFGGYGVNIHNNTFMKDANKLKDTSKRIHLINCTESLYK